MSYILIRAVKCEVKWSHLCQGVLQHSWQAIKKVDLIHVHPSCNHRTSELVQTAGITRSLQEPLRFVSVRNFDFPQSDSLSAQSP